MVFKTEYYSEIKHCVEILIVENRRSTSINTWSLQSMAHIYSYQIFLMWRRTRVDSNQGILSAYLLLDLLTPYRPPIGQLGLSKS